MRIILVAGVVILGANIGITAIRAVSTMQDSKMERFCNQVPVGASYDDVCAKYK